MPAFLIHQAVYGFRGFDFSGRPDYGWLGQSAGISQQFLDGLMGAGLLHHDPALDERLPPRFANGTLHDCQFLSRAIPRRISNEQGTTIVVWTTHIVVGFASIWPPANNLVLHNSIHWFDGSEALFQGVALPVHLKKAEIDLPAHIVNPLLQRQGDNSERLIAAEHTACIVEHPSGVRPAIPLWPSGDDAAWFRPHWQRPKTQAPPASPQPPTTPEQLYEKVFAAASGKDARERTEAEVRAYLSERDEQKRPDAAEVLARFDTRRSEAKARIVAALLATDASLQFDKPGLNEQLAGLIDHLKGHRERAIFINSCVGRFADRTEETASRAKAIELLARWVTSYVDGLEKSAALSAEAEKDLHLGALYSISDMNVDVPSVAVLKERALSMADAARLAEGGRRVTLNLLIRAIPRKLRQIQASNPKIPIDALLSELTNNLQLATVLDSRVKNELAVLLIVRNLALTPKELAFALKRLRMPDDEVKVDACVDNNSSLQTDTGFLIYKRLLKGIEAAISVPNKTANEH